MYTPKSPNATTELTIITRNANMSSWCRRLACTCDVCRRAACTTGKQEEPMQPADQRRLLADVESFCQELREHEELCYVEHRFNNYLIPLAQKYNLLGMPVPTEYGGRGSDTLTYARALARIGQEGTGVRTFFSGHTSIGQYPIMTWGSDEQKRRYLPPSCKGEKILAFGLTEP